MLFIILYIIVCLLWAIYSQIWQNRLYPDAKRWKDIVGFLMNFIGCPIAIIIAIIRFNKNNKIGK